MEVKPPVSAVLIVATFGMLVCFWYCIKGLCREFGNLIRSLTNK